MNMIFAITVVYILLCFTLLERRSNVSKQYVTACTDTWVFPFQNPLKYLHLSRYLNSRILPLSLKSSCDVLRTEEARTGIHRSLFGKR
jgi:hypothetical protein